MDDIASLHRSSLEATRRTVLGIESGQLGQATPCEGWDVRALLNHVVSGNLWAAELVRGRTIEDVGDALDGDVLGSSPLDAYDRSAAEAAAAFEAPGSLAAPCAVSYGPVPGEVYAGHRFLDVLVHGWDLAVATGQDTSLDPTLVDACLDVIGPQRDMLRASGMFGEERVVPTGASPVDQLLVTLGRQPRR